MRASSRSASSRKLWLTSAVGAFAAIAIAGTAWSSDGPKKDELFKVTHVIQVPNSNATTNPFYSFDISWYDRHLNKYFLADRNNKAVDVIDGATHAISQFPNSGYAGFTGNNDTSGPDGLATVNNHTEVWVGDSPGKVWVLDSTTLALKSLPKAAPNPILVGGANRADEFCTDTKNHVVMIASPAEDPPYVTFISTQTYKVVGKLIFDGLNLPMTAGIGHAPLKATNGLEQCGYSEETGKLYQNVPAVNGPAGADTVPGAVAVIDGKTMNVQKSFSVPLDACAGPQGMTMGPHNQILLGCNASSPNGHRNLAVINQHSGAILASIPDLGGADEVWYNDGDGHYFIASCNTACRTAPGAGTEGPELLGVVDANGLRVDQSVTIAMHNSDTTPTGSARTAHSVAANSRTNEVYLPIPAGPGGGVPHFGSSLCNSTGAGIVVTGTPSSATGCIVILKAKHDDRSRVARERDRDDRRDGDGDRDDHRDRDDHHHDD